MNENIKTVTEKSFKDIQTSLGKLYLFALRGKESIEIENRLDKPLKNFKSDELFKIYLPLFVYLEEDLVGEALERPYKYTFSDENIDKLSKNEIEEIARLFLEEHSYLSQNSKISSYKNENGSSVVKIKISVDDKSLLQKNNESYVEYFYRLIQKEDEKNKERFKKLSSVFSPALSSDILQTSDIGKSLQKNISSIKGIDTLLKPLHSVASLFKPPKLHKLDIPKIDFSEELRRQEAKRLAPFKDLSSKMNMMIEAEKQTVNFMDNVYKTQVKIASELKVSSDSVNTNSENNIRFTKIIIGLTIISIIVATLALFYPILFNNNSTNLIQTNENIKFSIMETNAKLEKLTKILIEQNKLQNEQIKVLNKNMQKVKTNLGNKMSKSVKK